MRIHQVLDFFKTCPLLKVDDKDPVVYVDFLPEKPLAFGVMVIPSQSWFRQYVDGGGIKQLLFVFRSMSPFDGRDIAVNTANIDFYLELAEWLEKTDPPQNWIKVEALTEGYFMEQSQGQDVAIYQIQCRVLYVHYNI